jgi:hypothetical protein
MRYGAAGIEISRFPTEVRPHVRAVILLRRFGARVVLRAVREGVVLRHVQRRRDGELRLRRRRDCGNGHYSHR